jgi:hypothetical protein
MSDNKEHEKFVEALKFTPCTYKIQMWGYGGEYVMGTVDRAVYDYFKRRRLNLMDYAWDSDNEFNVPDEMQPFPPGSWYECDNMGHTHGVDRSAGTLLISDENDETVVELSLEDIDGYSDDSPEWGGGDEVWINSQPAGTPVFIGVSNEKGTFFEGNIELKQPFDITKLCLFYDDIDGNEIINRVEYDGEEVENWGGSTDGKSSDFGFYIAHSLKDGKWEKYRNLDDIEYTLTDWFPKKIKPFRTGVYTVKTAGKNSYTYDAVWTGTRWINTWHVDDANAQEIKVKEWRGIDHDPELEEAV